MSLTFPDAPAGALTPPSAGSMYRTRLWSWLNSHTAIVFVWFVALVVAPVITAVVGYPVAAMIVAGLALLAAIIFLAVQWGRVQDVFWEAYAGARGLQHTEGGAMPSNAVPLMCKGDEREVKRTLVGRIGTCPATLSLYTYTEVSYTTDSNGHSRRQETDYDFTTVTMHLPPAVAARFRGIYLRRDTVSFGGLQDKLQHDRAVQLESQAFNDRYDLRVVDDQDDIALYELFSTTFVDRLAHDLFAEWEQCGQDLVLYRKGHSTDPAEIDGLCEAAAIVYARYAEEHQ